MSSSMLIYLIIKVWILLISLIGLSVALSGLVHAYLLRTDVGEVYRLFLC
jgi:hypothetical protein